MRGVVVLAVMAAALPLAAQVPALDSGRAVRIVTDSARITGRLVAPFAPGDAALRLCRYPGGPCDAGAPRDMQLRVAALQVRHLDVGGGTHWRRGAVFGALAGVAIGAGAASLAHASCDASDAAHRCASTGGVVVVAAASGVMAGALGALIGSAFPRWRRIF